MCLAKVERYLESHGWTRQVAGDADFDAAVLAVGKMSETGKGLCVPLRLVGEDKRKWCLGK